MFARPVKQLEALRSKEHSWRDIKRGDDPLKGLEGGHWEVRAEAEVGSSGAMTLNVRGLPILYDAAKATLSVGKVSAPLALTDGVLRLHVLVDRGSVEVFGEDGRVAISHGLSDGDRERPLSLKTSGTTMRALSAWELGSAWK